jgi:hypothetical protein
MSLSHGGNLHAFFTLLIYESVGFTLRETALQCPLDKGLGLVGNCADGKGMNTKRSQTRSWNLTTLVHRLIRHRELRLLDCPRLTRKYMTLIAGQSPLFKR